MIPSSLSLSASTKRLVSMLLSAVATATAVGVGGASIFYCSNSSTAIYLQPPDRKPSVGAHIPFPSRPKPTQTHHHPSPVLRSQPPLRPVALTDPSAEELAPSSAAALAAAIRRASPASPVEFTQRVEKRGESGLVLPSPDFLQLCVGQLDLFRMVVDHDAILSVYVRPAGSYVMDQLELRRVAFYPGIGVSESADCVILVGKFAKLAGLHAAEAILSRQQVEVIPDFGAVVVPMTKHPFVVGFLVAELPKVDMGMLANTLTDEQQLQFSSSKDGSYGLPPSSDKKAWEIQVFKEDLMKVHGQFTSEKRSRAIMISRSLAMAYVMDQKTMLLQQASWQNNARMSHLVEQIHGSLSSIRALSKMLSVHAKRSEISSDIVDDILIQGDHMKDALQQLQDAVYLTKANIVQYNKKTLKKMHDSTYSNPESCRSLLSNYDSQEGGDCSTQNVDSFLPPASEKDIEMPMPPLWLAPQQQHDIRPCSISDVLTDLVGAAIPLANKQQRLLEFSELSNPLQVAVEESALRQALSNLIEGALLRTHIGGKVQIRAAKAPAGGALIVIDDDGPDMHYMTQLHSLAPFGTGLFSDGMVEDNMTWNFVAGLTVAREILESYGCVVRVLSPLTPNDAVGSGGTRIELWLPVLQSDSMESAQNG